VTVKASKNRTVQQLSRTGMQQVPYQSLTITKFQRNSISFGIWFGTRGSEVQILSPRPIFSITCTRFWFFRHTTVDDFVDGRAFLFFQLEFKSVDSQRSEWEPLKGYNQIARSESFT